jgi:nucleoside-diphosphate-sugar epimerase
LGLKGAEILNTLVTGAAGFVGSALLQRLSSAARDGEKIFATDIAFPPGIHLSNVTFFEGEIEDAGFRAKLLDRPLQRVFHLATVAGVKSASDFQLGKRVNLEATIGLLDGLAKQAVPARLIYSSSVGIFGAPFPDVIEDDTLPVPNNSYGTHKFACELMITDYARAGLVDGLALRFPGIIARPEGSQTMLSAFVNNVFYAARDGRAFTLPLQPADGTLLMSLRRLLDNIVHASSLPAAKLPTRRAWTLPALYITMQQLVDALGEVYGRAAASRIDYQPVPAARTMFAMRPLRTPGALALGMVGDTSPTDLVRNVIAEIPALAPR